MIKGDYDDGFVKKKMVVINEVSNLKGDSLEEVKLKSAAESVGLITLNPKKEAKISQYNLWSLYFNTNNSDAIKISRTERRFYVVSTEDRVMKKNHTDAYFTNWLNNPEKNATSSLFYFLLNEVDLSNFNPHEIPERTVYMKDMIDSTDNDMESLLNEWSSIDFGLFSHKYTHPDIIRDALLREHSIKYPIKEIKKWLKNNGWVHINDQPQKKVNNKSYKKSRTWFIRKHEYDDETSISDLYDEIDNVERIINDSQYSKTS
jgi:hypothetical protein